jgi:hypothetical protein
MPFAIASASDTAARLAAAYDRCLAALDADGVADAACLRFAAWLAEWWRADGPPAPPWPPDAVSRDGRGTDAVRWYADAGAVRGYVCGARGSYLVPLDDPVPAA